MNVPSCTDEQLHEKLAQIMQRLAIIESRIAARPQVLEEASDYLNALEASKFLNLTKGTLYSKVCRKEIPVYKKGNRLYFLRSELISYISQGKKNLSEDQDSKAELKMHSLGLKYRNS